MGSLWQPQPYETHRPNGPQPRRGGRGCCAAPPQREPRRQPRSRPPHPQRPPGSAAPQLEPEPEPEWVPLVPGSEPQRQTESSDDGDDFYSCSDDEAGEAGGADWANRAALTTCCPPEHQGKLAGLLLEFGADAARPAAHTLWRFLRARKYDVERATAMYRAHLEWRATSSAIPAPPSASQAAALAAAAPELDANSAAAQGRRFYRLDARDPDGGVILCCVLSQWLGLGPAELDEALGAYMLFIEAMQRLVDEHEDASQRKWTLICDCSGLGPTSVPLKFLRRINAVFEPNYPERLKRSVLLPIPGFVVSVVVSAPYPRAGFPQPTA